MQAPPSRPLLLALAGLLLALAGLPAAAGAPDGAAAGDRVTFKVDEVNRLDPERGKAVNVTVTFCTGSGVAVAPGPRHVTLRALDAPAWLRAEFTPERYEFTTVLPNDCQRQTGLLRLNSTRAAPAFEPVTIRILAALDGDGGISHEEAVAFMSGFYGELAIRAPTEAVEVPAGGGRELTLAVENRGNALTRVRLDPVATPPGVAVASEGAFTLPPFGEGSNEHAAKVTVHLGAGAPTEPFEIRFLVSSHFQYDTELQGDGGMVVVRIVPGPPPAEGARFQVPGPSVLLLLLGLALAARLAR